VTGPQRRQAVIFSNKYDEFMGLFLLHLLLAAATAFSVTDFNFMPFIIFHRMLSKTAFPHYPGNNDSLLESHLNQDPKDPSE
jgi:hypothetical protein